MSARHAISADEYGAIVEALSSPVSYRKLARLHDRSECTIRRMARANGITERRPYHAERLSPSRQLANQRRDMLAEHMAAGGSFAGFARDHELSLRGVQYIWQRICSDIGGQAV